MRGAPTAIVASLPEEVAELRARMTTAPAVPRDTTLVPGVEVSMGRLAGRDVVLGVLGEGARRAAVSLDHLLAALAPARLFVVGIAGALSQGLEAGDLVISREVRTVALGGSGDLPRVSSSAGITEPAFEPPGPAGTIASFEPDPALHALARRALSGWTLGTARAHEAKSGLVVSAPDLVLGPSEKRELHLLTGGARPAVVDLESAPLAEVAARHEVPWLVLRAVSDTARERLPPLLARCRTPDGATDRLALVRKALVHPDSWRALFLLRRRVLDCARILADAVEEVLTCPQA